MTRFIPYLYSKTAQHLSMSIEKYIRHYCLIRPQAYDRVPLAEWQHPLYPWPIQSQVLGLPGYFESGSHLMEWALNQTGYWLVIPISFVTLLLYQHTLQLDYNCRSKHLQLAWCLTFSLIVHTVSSSTINTSIQGGCLQVRNSSTFLCSMSCGHLTFRSGLTISLWRGTNNFDNGLGCLEVPMEPF